MHSRSSYSSLVEHLSQRQAIIITGMRRVGKSTAVKYLLEHIKHKNKLYLDCERIEIRELLNRPNYEGIAEELQLKGLDLSKPCVIALDEVQLVENLPSLIKYLYDTYSIKFIVTGSSSYYMRNKFSESLAGRKKIFELYPLSFIEFLKFRDIQVKQPANYAWQSFNKAWYDRFNKLYEEYIEYGGFPEVVLSSKIESKKDLLHDIINSYIELDVRLLADFSASDDLYKLVKLLAARVGSKLDYTKLSSVSGINRQKISSYLQLLEYTYFAYTVKPFTTNVDKEISQQPKLYFSDTGILNALAAKQISSGQLFENVIAAQLKPQGTINYYQKKSGQEIDFIFNNATAIEVKETATSRDFDVLVQRSNSIKLKKHQLITRYPFVTAFENYYWGGNIFGMDKEK